MKVRRIVELLYQTYDPEQEIMAVWWGSEGFETKAGAWAKAVEIFDAERYIPSDYKDYLTSIVCDAEAEVEREEDEKFQAELAMDSYLDRVREEQAKL
jgi:hypothetical protein